MTRGGERNRGAAVSKPSSAASQRRRAAAHVLPAEGHRGKPPPIPLPDATEREATVWAEVWRSPQAAMWARESWRWRTIALWVRYSVRAEDPQAPAALVGQVHRLADQVGMTPAGLRENGWRIADPDAAADLVSINGGARRTASKPRRKDPRTALFNE